MVRRTVATGWARVRAWADRNVGIMMVIGAFALGGLYVVQVHRESERAACQAEYNATFSKQLSARAKVGAASDQAQSDLLSGVSRLITAKPTRDPKVMADRQRTFAELFRRFDAAAAKAEQARIDNPIPPLPDC